MANRLRGARFVMAVPIAFEGVTIGVLGVMDACACGVDAGDLSLVHLFSVRGSALLAAWVSGRSADELPYRVGPGVTPHRLFERMLEVELRLMESHGGSLELAIVTGSQLEQVQQAVTRAHEPNHLLGGMLGDGRFALFKRDLAGDARSKLAAVLDDAHSDGATRRMGVVDLSAGNGSTFHASELMRLAEQALDDALESGNTVRRLTLREENV
jgi:hypothetical protein